MSVDEFASPHRFSTRKDVVEAIAFSLNHGRTWHTDADNGQVIPNDLCPVILAVYAPELYDDEIDPDTRFQSSRSFFADGVYDEAFLDSAQMLSGRPANWSNGRLRDEAWEQYVTAAKRYGVTLAGRQVYEISK